MGCRTVALLHCRTACTAEPANVRTFPSSQPALLICAHISWPRHLAKAGPFCAHFRPSAASVRKVRTFFGCRGEIYSTPAKCAHKSREQVEREGNVRTFALVQRCDGATVRRCETRKRCWRTEQRSAGWGRQPSVVGCTARTARDLRAHKIPSSSSVARRLSRQPTATCACSPRQNP